MSDEHEDNARLTDSELDAVVGGAPDTETHYGCGLAKTLGDNSHSGQSPGHKFGVGGAPKVCYGKGYQ